MLSEEFTFALAVLVLALLVIAVAGMCTRGTNKSALSAIKIPLFGEVRTNVPAVSLCFLGVLLASYATKIMTERRPTLVNFHANLQIDDDTKDVEAVMVGVTSDYWSHWVTPSPTGRNISVDIKVPNSWLSYSFFVMSPGNKIRPYVIGTTLEEHEATLPLVSTTPKKPSN